MTKQFAINAINAFRSDKPGDGVIWFMAFLERYTDTRTTLIVDCVAAHAYNKAAELLELTVLSAF